ncbi:protein kinase [Cronbergia sp. UHCC 0137]|uniref:protein kinase domain-containing protein n=1 Tax=Cronbergia sp. UHCC 0137 TaxID=3110239 RepID=UPI002B204BE3|nr:protein kinase [Cronbergia sp. UHCC 0137]MEA5620114.1 protein kinase [Cronbergia sp. UHCC 0137]
MPAKITLTIIQGRLSGKQYIFDSRTTCIIGRKEDCYPRLPNDLEHDTISRYHCLLDINPPDIRVRDFGSLNGTYINGGKIGQRESHQTPEQADRSHCLEYDLQHGDEIKLGDTVFKVAIEVEQQIIQSSTPNFISDQEPRDRPNFLVIIKRLLALADQGDFDLKILHGYNTVKLLGKGRFGDVYLVQHPETNKYLVLKVMSPVVTAQAASVQTFLYQIENMKVLQHPNLVQLYNYGYAEKLFFLIMEYYEEGTVYDLMQQLGGKIPVDIAVDIIIQVLDGLIHTHNAEIPFMELANVTVGKGRGLVHRNLKPTNILLRRNNDKFIAAIGNYGLAKAFDLAGLSGQTLTKKTAGTPGFIPRQQVIDFKRAKPDVDVWATAACLYNMLTGYVPRNFTADPWLSVLQNNPVPIQNRDANIPAKLAKVIDLALIEKPQIHFQSAAEFKEALLSC